MQKLVRPRRFNRYMQLWYALLLVRHILARARERELSRFGVSPVQDQIMFIIDNLNKSVTITEISLWLFREPHTVSWIVGQMRKNGLVRKTRDPNRRNLVKVTLTKKGKEIHHRSMAGSRVIADIFSCLSEEESASLLSHLHKVRDRGFEALGTTRIPPDPLKLVQ